MNSRNLFLVVAVAIVEVDGVQPQSRIEVARPESMLLLLLISMGGRSAVALSDAFDDVYPIAVIR